MKGTGHLSREITKYGRELVHRRYKLKESTLSPTGYFIVKDGDMYACKIFTKRHDLRFNGMRVTGRDYSKVTEMQLTGQRILLLFVDASLGACYGDFLDVLMQEHTFAGITFPLISDTHSGKILYWNIERMTTLFQLEKHEVDRLAVLIADNKTNKAQIRLL